MLQTPNDLKFGLLIIWICFVLRYSIFELFSYFRPKPFRPAAQTNYIDLSTFILFASGGWVLKRPANQPTNS